MARKPGLLTSGEIEAVRLVGTDGAGDEARPAVLARSDRAASLASRAPVDVELRRRSPAMP
jgi:hypothetical protein